MNTSSTIRTTTGSNEYHELVSIWRSGVNATHDFLSAHDRDDIESKLASDYFPLVELFVAEHQGRPVGFAGVSGNQLEMLFVDANYHNQGIGSALLSYVVENCGTEFVDVNEQNDQATQFYKRKGFTVESRSERDDQGRPYPVLHLRRQQF